MIRWLWAFLFLTCTTPAAFAQSLGTFRWQLQPFCNVLTLNVAQSGGLFALDGFDDQCGLGPRASVTGTAFPNPDGTIGIGLTVVTTPGGEPLHLEAALSLATAAGSWRDSEGASGMFAFNPSAVTGSPRPSPAANQFPAGLVAGQTTFSADGGLVAGGTLGVGAAPASARGVRMVWLPAKGAFRAGYVAGNEWDDSNTGEFSVAMGYSTLAAGRGAIALGHSVGAEAFGIAIGSNASAAYRAVALGYNASADHPGAMVIGDSSDANGADLRSTAMNQFSVRAAGGYRLFSDSFRTAGVTLAPGASAWASVSDANMKENFRDLDGGEVLAKIARMPIREWNYKAQDAAIRHVGPTAQDFHAAFGLGEDPLRISTIDADGIALAAVKALALENQKLRTVLAALSERLERLETNRR